MWRFVCLSALLFCGPMVPAAQLTHGPIVGHTTDRSTTIWVRTRGPCSASVAVSAEGENAWRRGPSVVVGEEDNYCRSIRVEGLAPKTTYRYRLVLDGREMAAPPAQTVTTFPARGEAGVVRIGFGHSLRGSGNQRTWEAIARSDPDLFLLMGDNIYSNTTEPERQRRMYLAHRGDPCFAAFAARTPVYAVWDDHDYGHDNSDRTEPGKERSLSTFREIWPNPPSEASDGEGIWTRVRVGQIELFLLDVRYHRSPNGAEDGPEKTMLGTEQREWLVRALSESTAKFKFAVSGSSWNCGGKESWNHPFLHEYDTILESLRRNRVKGLILLGGDQHCHKIGVRPGESWKGYDLHEWMAGQIWNRPDDLKSGFQRGFGMITVDTTKRPATATLEFFDVDGRALSGKRIPYTPPGALRALWDSPPGATSDPPRAVDGELRPTSGAIWQVLPDTTGESLSEDDLRWPD